MIHHQEIYGAFLGFQTQAELVLQSSVGPPEQISEAQRFAREWKPKQEK